jgi:hypothetical protein
MSSLGCARGGLEPPREVWGLNDSTSDYVIRLVTSGPASGGSEILGSWELRAGSSGRATSARDGQMLEVLDAGTCALAQEAPLRYDVLIDIDIRGRVTFVPQPQRPAMNEPLPTAQSCTSPQPSTATT